MAQLARPTGHAVLPLPVTEAVRVPSAEEIAEAQSFGRRIEQAARRLLPHMNFSAAQAFAGQAVTLGKEVCTRALDGLKDAGLDVKDPLRLLYVLKRLGPAAFEEAFGVGEPDAVPVQGRGGTVASDEIVRVVVLRPDPRGDERDPGQHEQQSNHG